MLKMKKTIIILVMTGLILTAVPARAAVMPDPDIAAESALLIELTSGKVLYSKNTDERRPPDSLTKLVTVLIAADMCSQGLADKDAPVIMTQTALFDISSKNSTQNIAAGEEMTLLDLMYSAYLGSADEACNMIAEYIAGSVEDFIYVMNEYVEKLGCADTNFTTAHGSYDKDQYTTARDQYVIYREAIKNSLFSEIDSTYRYTVGQTNVSSARRLTNPNHMLNSDSKYYYRLNSGGRTGVSYEGGYSFVGHAGMENTQLISVILGSDAVIQEDESTLMRNLSETRRLFEWGFGEFSWRTILSESELVAKAPVTYGDGADYVNLRPKESISLFIETSIGDGEFVRSVKVYSVERGQRLYAPIEAGEGLGEITVKRGDVSYGTIELIANTDVDLHRVEFIRSQIKGILGSAAARTVIAVLVILLVVYIALVIRYNKRRRAHLRRVAKMKEQLAAERKNAYRK